MRPLKLEIEGFTAFKEPVCLDMTQLDLFAITGPTGAGKSSLIDAICYALYGRVPRVSNEVASCISQGLRPHAAWASSSWPGEERYRIFRETRRKGAGNVRLERRSEDGWQALSDRAKEVNESRFERRRPGLRGLHALSATAAGPVPGVPRRLRREAARRPQLSLASCRSTRACAAAPPACRPRCELALRSVSTRWRGSPKPRRRTSGASKRS